MLHFFLDQFSDLWIGSLESPTVISEFLFFKTTIMNPYMFMDQALSIIFSDPQIFWF